MGGVQCDTTKIAGENSQVVGYMGVPYYGTDMTSHPQYITVRNGRGREMLDAIGSRLKILPTMSSGDRTPFVMQTVLSDDACVPPTACTCFTTLMIDL